MRAGDDSGSGPEGIALVGFETRGDGTTHYYEQITSLFFSMQGIGVGQKARLFTESYDIYVREYCTPIS